MTERLSFRIDWFDLFVVQETLKSLLQRHIWKASNLWHSAFFMNQLSYPHMTSWIKHGFDYMDLTHMGNLKKKNAIDYITKQK